jgi:hypothetical protein
MKIVLLGALLRNEISGLVPEVEMLMRSAGSRFAERSQTSKQHPVSK